MLRYGDGTPFPFIENVLAILEDAVASCADMFGAAIELDEQREQARAARRVVEEEARKLAALEQSMIGAATEAMPASDDGATVSQRASQRAIAAVQRAVRDAHKDLEQLAQTKGAEPAWEPHAARVHATTARFFERQSLPGTGWTWSWDATGTDARAEATGHATPFSVTFDLDVLPVWRAPVRIGVLANGIVLQLPARRMFGAPSAAPTELDRLFLVRASVDADGRSLLVRERATASTGWRIVMPAQGAARCHLVDRDGNVDGPEFELARDEQLHKLWAAIDNEITTMHRGRRARELLLAGQPIAQIADPTAAPRAILDVLAPIVRSIRAHSRVPGELVLKRDVADGVRAELYVSREAIVAHYAQLPAEYKRFFDESGFGRGFTNPPEGAETTQPIPRFARASQQHLPQAAPTAQLAAPPPPPLPSRRRSFARLESHS